jgi:hypothetical protein
MGVLSALPLIGAANACCCLWFVIGGLIASYTLQQDQSTPITPGDGAMVGLLAGLLGAVVATLVSIPIDLVMGPMSREMLRGLAESNDLPPNIRGLIENMLQNNAGAVGFVLARAAAFVMYVLLGGFFSTLSGLLGAVLFSRRTPVVPPPDLRLG